MIILEKLYFISFSEIYVYYFKLFYIVEYITYDNLDN